MYKVLSISVHPDDSEYAMAGTAKLLADKGCEITFLNICNDIHYHGTEDSARNCTEAAAIVGAKKMIIDYKDDPEVFRTNPKTSRQVADVIEEIRPDILFMMYPSDSHMEHVECAKTTREALYLARGAVPNEIYSMECGPLQTMCYMSPHIYVDITSVIEDVKKSNLHFAPLIGTYLWYEKEKCSAFRGYQAAICGGRGAQYAEAFCIEKFPYGSNDFLLRSLLPEQFTWCSTSMYHPHAHPLFHT